VEACVSVCLVVSSLFRCSSLELVLSGVGGAVPGTYWYELRAVVV
jgi:hypothetical protein